MLLQHKPLTLENSHLRAELGPEGTVVSLVDKATGREALAAPGNRLELYDDRPVAFDAWDVDPAHLRTRRDAPPFESYEVVTESPLRAEVAFEREGLPRRSCASTRARGDSSSTPRSTGASGTRC